MLKNILKNHFLITKVRYRFNPAVQISQRQLFHTYQALARTGELPSLSETGFRVFSQFEEDGKILFIFSVIGMGGKRFVEIGSDDGVNSNSANLFFNFGWHGLRHSFLKNHLCIRGKKGSHGCTNKESYPVFDSLVLF